jgi:uncharacterized SAM-dependent methyltransferase
MRAHADEAQAAVDIGVLERIDRELGGDFDVDAFDREARFDPARERVEIHLVSRREQRVQVLGRAFALARGESIHVRTAHGYSLLRFEALAEGAGWTPSQRWTDPRACHALHVLERAG